MLDLAANLRVAAYVRVSTEEQAEEGFSLEAQRRAITSYAASQGWTIVGWYADEGKSAYSDKRRPAFERMMAERGTWDIAVAKWLNRFWRRVVPALGWAKELDAAGKSFACVSDRIDTSSAMGRAMFQMMLVMAELESGQTAERVRAAFRQKFDGGGDIWYSRAPLGYDLVNGKLVVNDAEADTVREIFRLAGEGVASDAIGDALPKAARGKQGGRFHQVRVLHILHNPVYAGYVYYDGKVRRNGHAPLVPNETFNATQVRLYMGQKKARRSPLIVGADEIECARINTSRRDAAIYVPIHRPPDLDSRVAQETARRARSSR